MTAQATPLVEEHDIDISEAPTHALAQRHAHKYEGQNVAYVRIFDMDGTLYPSGKKHGGDPRFKFEDDLYQTFTDGVAAERYKKWKAERGICGKDDDPRYFEDRVRYVLKHALREEALNLIRKGTEETDDLERFVDSYIADNLDDSVKLVMASPSETEKALSKYKGYKRDVLETARREFKTGVQGVGNFAIVASNMGVDSIAIYTKVVERLKYNQLGYAPGSTHRHSTNIAFEAILNQNDGVQNFIWTNAVPWHAAHCFRGMGINHDQIDGVFANWHDPNDLGKDPHMAMSNGFPYFFDGMPWREDKLKVFGGPLKTEPESMGIVFMSLREKNPDADVIVVQVFENSLWNLDTFKTQAKQWGDKLGVMFDVEAVGFNWDGEELTEEQSRFIDKYAAGPYALVDFVEEEFGVEIRRSNLGDERSVPVDVVHPEESGEIDPNYRP